MKKREGKQIKQTDLKPFQKLPVAVFMIILFFAVTIILLGSFGILDYKLDKDRQRNNLRKELSYTAEQLSLSFSIPVWNFDFNQIENIIESTMTNQNIYGIVARFDNSTHIRARGQNWEIVAMDKEFPTSDLLVEERNVVYKDKKIGDFKIFASKNKRGHDFWKKVTERDLYGNKRLL